MVEARTKSRKVPSHVKELDLAILRHIAENPSPIGQGALSLLLKREGHTVSTPTVGRRLQQLEFEGILRKVSVDGRVITQQGLNALQEWKAEAKLQISGEVLLGTLRQGDTNRILELLASRRVIERETAALAAEHASPSKIRRMEQFLKEQAQNIEVGGMGIEQDVAFHVEIARAARNAVLLSLVQLLRDHPHYNLVITSMRAVVGGRLVVEHKAILDAIARHDPHAARQAMDEHLGSLAQDMARYAKGMGKAMVSASGE